MQKQRVSPESVQYPSDMIHRLETTITLPLTRNDGTSPTKVLFKAGTAEITLQTALDNPDELALFLERHYWAVRDLHVRMRFEENWVNDFVMIALWKCMKMFVPRIPLWRQCSFSVKYLVGSETRSQRDLFVCWSAAWRTRLNLCIRS